MTLWLTQCCLMCYRYAQPVSPVSLSFLCSSVDSFATSLLNWLFSTRSFSAGSFAFVPWVLSNTHKAIHPGFVMNTITHFPQRKVLNLLFAKDSNQNPWTLSFRSTKNCCFKKAESKAKLVSPMLMCLNTDTCHRSRDGFSPPESHCEEDHQPQIVPSTSAPYLVWP